MAYPIFDMHCDTADRLVRRALPADYNQVEGMSFCMSDDDPSDPCNLASSAGHISLDKIGDTPWAQCFACFVPDELSPEQACDFHSRVMRNLAEQAALNANRATTIDFAHEIRPVLEGEGEPHVAAIHTIENARMFAADLGLVENYAQNGLLMASLSWNAAGPLASGHDTGEGVTEAGRAAIREMARLHVALDVSHLNDRCFAEVARLTDEPLVASHSNSRALCGHRRNLTDEQFCEIRDRGGVVGLNYCTYFLVDDAKGERGAAISYDEICAHVEHWLELGGENVVALGSDMDGCATPAVLDGADKAPAFQSYLESRFGAELTRKLCYENALSFFERYCG